jgi:hypothetical protein
MFDYLGVLISIILGLALTHLLWGLSRLIHMRRTIKIYWVHVVWVLNTLIYVLAIWWGMYWWKHQTNWTIQQFFFLAGYATVLFMLGSMLFPPDCPSDIDLEAYFFHNRLWFFGIQLAAMLLDIPETLLKGSEGLRAVPREYLVVMPLFLTVSIIGLSTANRKVHAVLAPAWLAIIIGYVTMTSLDKIVT